MTAEPVRLIAADDASDKRSQAGALVREKELYDEQWKFLSDKYNDFYGLPDEERLAFYRSHEPMAEWFLELASLKVLAPVTGIPTPIFGVAQEIDKMTRDYASLQKRNGAF